MVSTHPHLHPAAAAVAVAVGPDYPTQLNTLQAVWTVQMMSAPGGGVQVGRADVQALGQEPEQAGHHL